MTQYDRISEQYLQVEQDAIKRCVVLPTLRSMIGDVRGRAVLDAGCGSGYFTRILRAGGAGRVVGIDVSGRQISLARERTRGGDIEYRALAASDLIREFGREFDLVTGVFLLNYAESLGGLIKMLSAICGVLKPGGRFAGITQNPRFRFYQGIRFQRRFRRSCAGKPRDGEKFFIEFHTPGGPVCEVYCFHWSAATYRAAFAETGFRRFHWVRPAADCAGRRKEERAFFADYLKNPHITGLAAEKTE
jgi:SAM-dependent methyltransferase